jgi:hypothetical protein
VSESLFTSSDEGLLAGELARGPWDPETLHGGAPAALITSAFEAMEPDGALRIARLGFELLRPVPFEPLSLSLSLVRPGRRVQELTAELRAGELLICRASAVRVSEVPGGLPAPASATDAPQEPMPGPEHGTPVRFSLDGDPRPSFAGTAMEMRWLDDPREPGPARVWMRLRAPLLDGEAASPLARLAATADFANGVSAALPFEAYLFINADLSVHLHREPRGEWIGIDARTLLNPGGMGLSESVLHDLDGPVGRSFQTLVVGAR